ncbi:MAG: beta-ketoacyl-ACP synthase II [Pseudobdellovibrionaceae bacterium]|nr:beta-ketoacyl-ACP synthase II [Bdellovibrionales bacterium]USN48192.1 MAG: beta-ketoacyl-ACP synthase II [Pseudobdellovibrionaceae bacterium]
MSHISSESIFKRHSREQRRVVVTGMGMLTPLGLTLTESWDAVVNGQSGISTITQFDASELDSQIAGEVKNFDPDPFVPKKEQKKMDRFIHFAMAASEMAILDAGLGYDEIAGLRSGALVGVGIGGLPLIERQHEVLTTRGASRITPFFIPACITNLASGQISMRWGLKGPNFSVTSACASGNHSIGEAAKFIMNGEADIMIAGGSEATISPLAAGGFAAMKALSTRNSSPETASRPWDVDRDGFVLSEGAAILVLEDFEHAEKRGARIYGELRGYGVSSDAYHMSAPSPGGEGAARAMKSAITNAYLNVEDIGYINAHGTSTPVGDSIETQAIKSVFGDHAYKLWISSTKSMTGHTLGAAGAIESVFSLMTLTKSVAPPTINLDSPSEDCDLDYVPGVARERNFDHVINNSFGFGGTNACLVFSKINS